MGNLTKNIISGLLCASIIGGVAYWSVTQAQKTHSIREAEKQAHDSLLGRFWKDADRNNDGVVTFEEQVKAYRDLGRDTLYFQSRGTGQFLPPTMEELKIFYKL